MKVNFKKIFTAFAATVMCAVPMSGSFSASAAGETNRIAEFTAQTKQNEAVVELARVQAVTGVKATQEAATVFGGRVTAFDPDHGCGSVPLKIRKKGRIIVIIRGGVIIIIIIVDGVPTIVGPRDPRVRNYDLVNFRGFETINAKTYGEIDKFVGNRTVTNTIIREMNAIDRNNAIAVAERIPATSAIGERVTVSGIEKERISNVKNEIVFEQGAINRF
ncbi:hypothetical protein [Ruminococcus flavefaciens]|uniref:Uncharacterized protein n=1 Tax=Ruminococcus flavefaciens 007c TaxID=1341157 RepID=W7UDY1_RUMFL|nr:hypothetical protein [Ruminococcus flavefaciens]EWM53346.1 hypothetical protein RF007C_10265 [Ruminococcus flavefaciens 007c]